MHTRVFMSERLFIALAMEGGDAYHGDGWITAIARDVEGMAAGLTGGMIETGGLNVAHLGSEAKRVQGRTEAYTDGHLAFSFMRDVAFAEAKGGDTAAFEKAYKLVKKLLAKVVFAREERMRKRLAETSVLLEENGLDVLAKADAEAFRERRECPTYDTIDAGTFARALAAESGRKGGASSAKLVSDFNDPKVAQSPEEEQKAKNIMKIDWTQAEKDAHVRACEGGGGTPRGGFSTKAEKDAHAVAIVLGKLKKRGCLPQGPVADDNPAGALRGDAPGSASDPAASPAGDGAQRFTGKKKDPKSVRGALTFIEMGVPLICSNCDAEETSRWYGSKADPNKPVCYPCSNRQVRRASHSLASIVCILSALPVFVTDAYVMFLHSSPPPAGTAPAARSPVRSRARCSGRSSRSALGCARSAGTKKRPPTASAPCARRAWTRCCLGASRSASRARRGSATRATSARCAHPGSSHPFTRTRTRDVLRRGSALAHSAPFAFPVLRSATKS